MFATLPRDLASRLPGETPALDAQVLLAHVTGRSRAWVLSHPEAGLTPGQESALETAIRQLQEGAPLPYVIGHWEFFGLDLDVTPDVLIPRPETELLVETALGWVRTHPEVAYRFVDVGTGSGCIPVALAVHVPRSDIMATDISPAALTMAQRNAEKHGVENRITFVECDLLPSPFQSFDILTANLPYIPTETLTGLDVYKHEPTVALYGGPDGLSLIRQLLALLTAKTDEGSLVLLEIEQRQGAEVSALARAAFPDADIHIKKDLAGIDRLAVIET